MNKIVFKDDNGRAYIGTSPNFTVEDKLKGAVTIGETGAEAEDVDVTALDSPSKESENGLDDFGTTELELYYDKVMHDKHVGYRKSGETIYFGAFITDKKTGEVVYNVGYKGVIKSVKAGAMAVGDVAKYKVTVKLNGEVAVTEPTEPIGS